MAKNTENKKSSTASTLGWCMVYFFGIALICAGLYGGDNLSLLLFE